MEWNIGKGSYGICDVGFYGIICVVVKRILWWNEFKIEEVMILRKFWYLNI